MWQCLLSGHLPEAALISPELSELKETQRSELRKGLRLIVRKLRLDVNRYDSLHYDYDDFAVLQGCKCRASSAGQHDARSRCCIMDYASKSSPIINPEPLNPQTLNPKPNQSSSDASETSCSIKWAGRLGL